MLSIFLFFLFLFDQCSHMQTHAIATLAPFHSVCHKCGVIKKSGKNSCCGRGGSWFKHCASVSNADLHHTWYEGIHVCETRPQSKRASGHEAQRLTPCNGVDLGISNSVTTTPKVFAVTSGNTSILISGRTPSVKLVNPSVNMSAQSANMSMTSTLATTNTVTITAVIATTTMITQAVNAATTKGICYSKKTSKFVTIIHVQLV